MRIIIDNMVPQRVNFCGYEALAVILNRYEINFLKDILGVEWGFRYERNVNSGLGVEYEQWKPEYYFTSELHSIKDIMHLLYGYKIEEVVESDYYSIQDRMKDYLARGYPLIVDVDAFELPYFDEYKRYHPKSPHCIIVYGYDDEIKKYFFMDSFRGHVEGIYHKISFDDMKYLFVPKDNIFHLKYRFWFVDKVVPYQEKRKKAWIFDSMQYMAARGFEHMKELEEDLALISKWGMEKHIKPYKDEIMNMSILVSQQRYGNYLYINANSELFCSGLLEEASEIFKKWNSFKLCLYNIRNREYKDVFVNASIILNEIREKEKRFIYNCIKAGG